MKNKNGLTTSVYILATIIGLALSGCATSGPARETGDWHNSHEWFRHGGGGRD